MILNLRCRVHHKIVPIIFICYNNGHRSEGISTRKSSVTKSLRLTEFLVRTVQTRMFLKVNENPNVAKVLIFIFPSEVDPYTFL